MKNLKVIVGTLIITVAIGYLIYSGMSNTSASYSLPVEKALSGEVEPGKFYRIEGKIDVINSSFDGSKNPVELKFSLYDEKDTAKKLNVILNDVKPDNFAQAISGVVEGRFNEDGTFHADRLILKCPTKYEAAK